MKALTFSRSPALQYMKDINPPVAACVESSVALFVVRRETKISERFTFHSSVSKRKTFN